MSFKKSVMYSAILQCLVGTLMFSSAQAETKFVPEKFTVEQTIKPGPNVIVNGASWDGASKIHIYGQEELNYQGSVSAGLVSQTLPSKDGKQLYVLSHYMKRYTYGPVESAVQIFDINTLTEAKEIIVPNKAAHAIGMPGLLERNYDDSWIYVQNATPATSVTVVDKKLGKVINEVAVPGCFGIFPAKDSNKFSTLCGTGAIKTVTFNGNKYEISESKSGLFDVKKDALYVQAIRNVNGLLMIPSFNGNIYMVDDSGKAPKLVEKISITKGTEGNWAPGGYQVMSYNKSLDMIFVLMHPDAYEGSHKDASSEIWAYSMDKKKIISRSPAENLVALAVSQGKTPILFGSNEEDETVDQYTLADAKAFTFTKAGSDDKTGWSTNLQVDQ